MPDGGEERLRVAGADTTVSVTVDVAEPAGLLESDAWMTRLALPAAEGIPEREQLLMDKPAGSVPFTREHV
jgi:hypothetical protein